MSTKHKNIRQNLKDPHNLMARRLDKLAEYEEFTNKVAKPLRKLLLEGKSDTEIIKHFKGYLGARLMHVIMTSRNDNITLNAIREAMDRVEGKPVAKVQNTHKFEKLSEAELDAVIESEIRSLEKLDIDTEGKTVDED